MISEIQANSVPSVAVGQYCAMECVQGTNDERAGVSEAFSMVQTQVGINILESKFQAECRTFLYRVQQKVKSVNVKVREEEFY